MILFMFRTGRFFSGICGILWVTIFLTGCATSPPVQEMSDARQAIAAAREAGAEQYAADQLSKAETQLEAAETDLKSGMYWSAKISATDAKDTALNALLASRTAREAADKNDPR